MSPILSYLFEVTVCAGALWFLYVLWIDRKVSYPVSRFYLLFSLVLPYLIPALRIPVYPAEKTDFSGLQGISLQGLPVTTGPASIAYGQMVWMFGILISSVLILRLFYSLYTIHRYKAGATVIKKPGYTLVESPNVKSPFSIFKHIYIGKGLSGDELQQVIAHEQSHIRHLHSLEVIFCEVISSLGWFNPLVWILRRHLIAVHEFEADRDVMENGYPVEVYSNLILKQLFGYTPEIANGFNQSLTKKRFIMMTQKPVNKYVLFRIAAVFPVILALLMVFSFTEKTGIAQNGNTASVPLPENQPDPPRVIVEGAKSPENSLQKKETTATSESSFNISSSNGIPEEKPLWIVDGKEIDADEAKALIPDSIASLEVLKDETAIQRYGDKGKNGVIIVTLKHAILAPRGDVLWIIDGKITDYELIKDFDTKRIERIEVLKDEAAIALYGDKARVKKGVIVITTKEAGDAKDSL